MSESERLRTVGEVSTLLGVSVRTLHYWQERGLVTPAARSWSEYLLYSDDDIARLQQILLYRATGMSLDRIHDLIDGDSTPIEQLKARTEDVEQRLAEAMSEAVEPGSDRANELAEEHRELLSAFFPVSYAKHVILARGYVADDRFRSYYDKRAVGLTPRPATASVSTSRYSR